MLLDNTLSILLGISTDGHLKLGYVRMTKLNYQGTINCEMEKKSLYKKL